MPPSYPDYRHGDSIDSDRTASDATLDDEKRRAPPTRYRDDENAIDSSTEDVAAQTYPPRGGGDSRSGRPGRNGRGTASRDDVDSDDDDDDANDDDAGTGKLRLDEEEEVGLMQLDRDGKSSMARKRRGSLFLGKRRGKGRRGIASGGFLVFVGVLAGFALAIPLLQWLSSSGPYEVDSTAGGSSVHASQGKPPAASGVAKVPASSNDGGGHWGLAHFEHARVNFEVPGWDSVAEAAAGTGLSESEVSSFKTADGKDLMPLDLDIVLGGTLRPQREDLTWSAEDPDVGVFSHVDWTERDIYIEDVTHARKDKLGEGDVAKGGGKVLYVEGKDVLDHNNHKLTWTSYKISPDMKWVMFFSSEQKQWRYSQHANVWLHSVADKKTTAIGGGPSWPPTISYAAWAPLRRQRTDAASQTPGVAYVQGNNLFFIPKPGALPVQITNDGDATIFNAVPDWVYEEEVFSSDSAMWFSPGGSKLVFLRFDETKVPIYEFPVYNPDPFMSGKATPYLETTKMRYPKPGYPNPLVSAHMVDLDEIYDAASRQGGAAIRSTPFVLASPGGSTVGADKAANDVDAALTGPDVADERLVTEVTWLNDDELLVRETDRFSDVMRLVLYQLGKGGKRRRQRGGEGEGNGVDAATRDKAIDVEGRVVRRDDARKDGKGWIRAAQTLEPLSHHDVGLKGSAYLDIVVSPLGYRHLALYGSSSSDEPVFLTAGPWEVDELVHVDARRRRAYFTAARPSPAERHLYSVDLPDWSVPSGLASYSVKEPEPLTDHSRPGYYSANFDPKGAYYVLDYKGPDVPYQKVVGVDNSTWEMTLEDNSLLRQISSQYVRPQSVFYNLTLNGTTLPDGSPVAVSVKELRPHDFDASGRTQYPVLVQVYGGPDSQMVAGKWDRADWHQYLATTHRYIVCTIDARGTGFRGQAYRASVAGNLGDVEARDVNAAARLISSLPYVDAGRMGVWGWSYGGYLSNKVVERNEHLFNLSMSVAPVTNWRFYDSVYTERYMKSTTANAAGYEHAGVHVANGHLNVPILLAHGTADDNVHFQHSAHLIDMLTKARARGWRFRMFTDSAHSMQMRGAYRELYEEMTEWLVSKWGKGARVGDEAGKASLKG
ncbi:uncharacterized protein PFL1_05376 [Pseudozyma flocculosa PF-1]|uniref:Related to dipeptidyl aminopeptidase B n=2 Tax=Pseudozyma flocculosa TaxID=84751 RepID=A0A5C3FAS4_9BASI|nr:uncharacterized protein PFL1_05376 [Pseudozyma flocculosa PF-1]EPQ27092.1 hypothetical protein PFL1_05376 [Pseudozyma flocculosa PF-1]SPO41340.1 related to dipeptidyl aminopeptidase B [Pseudozyma flocculosa]